MRLRIAAIALLTITAFAIWYFAIHEPEPQNDLERFQGGWQISIKAGDQTRATDNAVRVTGDRWEYLTATTNKAYRLTLNEAADPKQIDLELIDTAGLRGPPVKMHGIYAFDGNKSLRVILVAAASNPRPTTFDDPDGGVLMLTKVKLEQDPQPTK